MSRDMIATADRAWFEAQENAAIETADGNGDWVFTGTCSCNAPLCGPGSGHESYCGWEQQ